MTDEKARECIGNEKGHCGRYCERVIGIQMALRKPAAQLLDLSQEPF